MALNLELQKQKFDRFVSERLPVLHEFAQDLGFRDPHEILINPESLLVSLDEWVAEQEIDEDGRIWISTRLGYFIGEYFAVKYSGCWSVCESESSRYYGYFVVGQFASLKNQAAIFDPMSAGWELANMPKGRSLSGIIKEIECALNAV